MLVLSQVHSSSSAELCPMKLDTSHTRPPYILVLDRQPCRSCLCLKSSQLYIVHVNTFPSPNSRQLLNPGRLTGVSGQCPGVTSGAFIICLVGSDPVYRGMQPSGALTIIPIAQVSSSLFLYATCREDSCSLYLYILLLQEKGGQKVSSLFTVTYSCIEQHAPSVVVGLTPICQSVSYI